MKFDISIKWRCIGMYEAGKPCRWISNFLNVPRRTVGYWICQYQVRGTIMHKLGAGRPRKTSSRANRLLVRLAKKHRFASARCLLKFWGEQVTYRTVYRRLLDARIKRYRTAKKPLLTKANIEARKQWSLSKSLWHLGRNQWNFIVWSDESRFRLFNNDGRTRVWREKGERFKKGLVSQAVQCGGGSVHVWGAFWKGGRSELQILHGNVNSESYCRTISNFLESDNNLPDQYIFQHDNAPAHRSCTVKRLFENHGIRVLPWPARSPDLNPIENVWGYIGHKINSRDTLPNNLEQLRQFIVEEWVAMPQSSLDSLVDTMPRRVNAVNEARGWHTKY